MALNNSGELALSGNVGESPVGGAPSGSLTLTGDGSGTLILSGTNSYTGGTNVGEGTLIATDGGAIPDASSLTVGAGGVFIFDPSMAGAPMTHGATFAASPAGAVAAVPEPGTIAILLAALWSAVIYRRFRWRKGT